MYHFSIELPPFHPSFVRSVKCSRCGFVSDDNSKFREFIGNVFVPNEGGVIGNNFFGFPTGQDKPIHGVDPSEIRKFSRIGVKTEDGTEFHVCSTVLCIPCIFEVMELPDMNPLASSNPQHQTSRKP